jgi:hypothetical protein
MSRRIEVELTSRRDDNTWTWRAAGAKQPRGVLDGSLLHDGASIGDVVWAEADIGVDGIEVIAVLPPKERKAEPERLEIIGRPVPEGGVTTSLVPGRSSRGRDRRPGDESNRRPRSGRDGREPRRDSREPRRDGREGERAGRGDTSQRHGTDGRHRREPVQAGSRREAEPRARRPDATPRPPEKPRPKRLRPGRAHRNAWLESLPEERRPVAEQLARGGMASVRKEIEAEIAKARAEGRPEISAEPLMSMAEELLPRLRQAEWHDRADAALADVDELDLRDLRTVVVAADDAARDPASRELADQLRSALTQRVEAAQKEWLDELSSLLSDGRVVRALRVSSRPPKAGEPLPVDLAQRLADAAAHALEGDVGQQRLAVVIDAIAFSPVRQRVELVEVPAHPGEELLGTVTKLAQHVPQIAAKFGIEAAARPAPRRGRPRPPAPPPPPPPASAGARPPSEPVPEPVAEPEPLPQLQTEPEPSPEPVPEPEPLPQSQAEPEPLPHSQDQTEPEPNPEPVPEPEPLPQPQDQPEPLPQPQDQPEPLPQPQAESSPAPQAQPEVPPQPE